MADGSVSNGRRRVAIKVAAVTRASKSTASVRSTTRAPLGCEIRFISAHLKGDLDAVRAAAIEGARLSRETGDLYSLDTMLMNLGFAAFPRSG
jgi:hypothetical protein